MSKVTIIRHKVSGSAASGGAMPIADAEIIKQQAITTSATSQKFATLVAEAENEAWTVIVDGGKVVVKFGKDPTATATDGWPLPDGTLRPFFVPKGWTAAVIDG